MMYIDALTKGIDDMPTVSDTTRGYVLSLLENHGLEGVLAQLQICDPAYYLEVDRANTRRVVHALEVSLQAGVPYSSLRTGRAKQRDFKVLKLAIDWPREELFARINARVDAMIDAGLPTRRAGRLHVAISTRSTPWVTKRCAGISTVRPTSTS